MVTRTTTCYVWNQTVAKRGSNEISSCLKLYIESLPPPVKTIYLFADNCPGQSKNRFIIQMLTLMANKRNITVNLVYLEKGHTQNINDTAHSVIDRAKSGVNIHHPSQWNTLIEKASRKNPYKVVPMGLTDFFNFQTDLAGVYNPLLKDSTPCTETNKKTKVHWLKMRHIQSVPSNNGHISIGVRYDVLSPFTNVIIGNLPKGTRAGRKDLTPPQLNEQRLPVSKALLKVSLLKVKVY